ncbi:MAG: pyruvate, phosphate dikinase [Rhodospirillaceae bacterium]|jgi:pyruvate, orthophosphate dikinase|nr:pyruvate, phosphate dikinase [Rhodospirillaceae bacterium]MBT5659319.1 pyruvate, phosphate dikinase [Rhodospirillaceae bacterium]MBT5752233.1 pyruvate, phosphate dikinase [Rhodospirillaceae bacterium]
MTKWVYSFGDDKVEGGADMKDLLGGKGANLAEMSRLNLPVPPGFTITTEICAIFDPDGTPYPSDLAEQVKRALARVEKATGMIYGDPENSLLLSVRSGGRVSMPGMMDTVLDLGLNDQTVEGLASHSGDSRFAYDSYRRFIQMYGSVVLGIAHEGFEKILEAHKKKRGFRLDTEFDAREWREVVADYKILIEKELGRPFPQDVNDQLWGAIGAVFGSWMTPRAVEYRRIHEIPGDWGTAVTVQAMVFGNMGDDCATGVAFTRNPATGEKAFFGEFMINAQGEDVVAGIRTPQPLTKAIGKMEKSALPSLEEMMPVVFAELDGLRGCLETHFRDMQDIEFTIQKGKLWMLQTRCGKRSAAAALQIAVDMVEEGLISRREAVCRIEPSSLDQLLHPRLDPLAEKTLLARGLPASPGAASGAVVFNADDAEAEGAKGPVILVRIETSPEDIHGMNAAKGILTTRGGMTSHAAVVARGMGRPCVTAARDLRVDYENKTLRVMDNVVKEGETITLNGSTGEVFLGEVKTIESELSDKFTTIMAWADEIRRLGVRANAETREEVETALKYGAEGIGLARTEHMFFDPDRVLAMREMIMANDREGRERALARLLPIQRRDFVELFSMMAGHPVTVRLLDPPLHEFLPHEESEFEELAAVSGVDVATMHRRAARLQEFNPMLGHRGCRLGITYPEIYEMQVQAILEAALEVSETSGASVAPEIMVPLVATAREMEILKEIIDRVAAKVFEVAGRSIPYHVGTMIELPRAALCAADIAQTAEFFSFGTNDLTQTTYGLSRDDAGSFIPAYRDLGIFEQDPFSTLDLDGVGEMISIAAERGRKARPDIQLGICGEHGGDPASIHFCEKIGLDYVSCSPFRVPIARLAAAQAAIRARQGGAGS